MGRRGPKPKSARQTALTGNAGRRPVVADAPAKALRSVPAPPDHLSSRGKAHWRQFAADLVERELLTASDLIALAMLAQAWDDYLEALQDIEDNGATGTTDKGYEYARPSVQLRAQASATVLDLSKRFGLTPLDRVGLAGRGGSGGKTSGDPVNPLEAELGKKH